mmetsp:Transcript_20309/g.36260  ORF Transcript_20309/g.36260 Transcript_20309/m.36260 type:complete len:468 (-) Transcript_20309:159-1562(-)|eukprot:CAMPEP_0197649158 /NCGR_PEP_ID=MMETSP1338-20131121/28183_1 /TAXON_ID=43686 ORGANISM="Pelagodinium beii, Strain RCC1491" /NCGR_SAMPLE_ID=MMETSP1338 /ASSEMBLY_ACC=CAM_ASM_000754 /LENGTH=467 /DNA_ID=CAMNT_0043223277 /DNA_START=79 /DNA_END=1482 /DNA_ORIENTATION=-
MTNGVRKNAPEVERQAVDKYVKDQKVEEVVQGMMQQLLQHKPENPRKFLLNMLEQDIANESDELSDLDLQRLFMVSRRITAEIIPQETISLVISETLQLLNCDTCSLFVLDRKMEMLRLYASNLETPIMVKVGQGIAGSVFNSRELVNIPDCYQDERFDKSFDAKTGYYTRSMIVVPIIDYDGQSCGVIQAINKMPTSTETDAPTNLAKGKRAIAFSRQDEKMLLHLTQHVAIAMRNAELYREAIQCSERATGLLNTIQSLSQDLGTQSMLLTMTMHASKVCSAERSTVFMLDEAKDQLWSVSTDTGAEIRIPKRAGIAGECCCDAKVINIPDAYADARFNQQIDIQTGFRTKSILAIPMLGTGEQEGECLGVIQVINKVSYDGQLEDFDDDDVEIMQLFASFVGPKLATSSLMHHVDHQHGPSSEGALALGRPSQEITGGQTPPGNHAHSRKSRNLNDLMEEPGED